LTPGAVVEVEIDLLPVGLVFRPGEQLRLVISAQNLFGQWMPALREYTPKNKGRHVVHTGGNHASYLQLPVQTGLVWPATWRCSIADPDRPPVPRRRSEL